MAGRALGAGALALAMTLTVGVAGVAAPTGPRLAVVEETREPSRVALVTVGPDGERPVRLAGGQEGGGPVWGRWPLSWSPDGAKVAFSGLGEFFLAKANGGGASAINAAGAERPIFAPDGHTVAFTRGETSIWTIDLNTWQQRRLTPPRRGLAYVASSFSPDGTTLTATRFDSRRGRRPEPVALRLDSGRVTRLHGDGFGPVYSPDGSKVALFRDLGKGRGLGDLFVLDLESGSLRRLTRTPGHTELSITWDPSGERIAFARFRGRSFARDNSIVQINADGSCETTLLAGKRTTFYGPAWQPGPGREAGPIEC